MISMVSGSRFRAEAGRRADLLLRAAAHARVDDRRLRRKHQRPGASRDALRAARCCCCSPSSCCRSAAISSSGPCAATRCCAMSGGPPLRPLGPAAVATRGRRSSVATWRWGDRLGARPPGARGCFCAWSPPRRRSTWATGASSTCTQPALQPSRPRHRPEPSGGFLDPLLGTAMLTAIGARSRAAGDLHARSGSSSTAATALAGSPGRGIEHRDRRRHPGHRDRALRLSRSSSCTLFGPLSSPRRRRWRIRPLVPRRRRDDVADRAAADLRGDPRRPAGGARPDCVRPPTRSARPASRRSAACCCRACAPTSPPA